MKINRIMILAALAAFVATAACQREPGIEVPEEELGPVFVAKLGQPTRSHFNSEDEGTDNAGTLYWDTSDKVGLTSVFIQDESDAGSGSFNPQLDAYLEELSANVRADYKTAYLDGGFENAYLGAELQDFMVMSLADITIHEDDPTIATLHPALTGSQWFSHADRAVGLSVYTFMGVYPVQDVPNWQILCWENDHYVIGAPLEVAHVQNGVDYGKYHICFDSGIDLTKPQMGLYYMEQVLARMTTITITNMNPLTSLIRFRMRVEGEPVSVKKLVITLEDENRTQDRLSGDVFITAEGPMPYIMPNRWSDATYNDVIIQFDTPVLVSDTPTDPYYAVLISSRENDTRENSLLGWLCNRYSSSTIHFDAYDATGNLLFSTTKTAPEHGFQRMGRYDITLTLGGSTPEETFTATSAGQDGNAYDFSNPDKWR